MADQNQDNVEQQVEQKNDAVEYTALEQEAMQQGWVPENEYNGDPDRFVSAKEFIQRGEFFKKIDHQNRQIREYQKQVEHLASLSKKSFEAGVQKAMADLKQAKKEAFAEGDADKLIEIDEQMDHLKEQAQQLRREQTQQIAQTAQEIHPELQSFINRNSWYENDKIMRAAADTIGVELAQSGMSATEVLREVEKRIKTEFPHKFHNPNRERAGAVEGGSAVRRSAKNDDVQLTPLEQRMMKQFAAQGVMSEKEYKDQIRKINNGEV